MKLQILFIGLTFSLMANANPLGMIFSRSDSRVRLELEHRADGQMLDDKKETIDQPYQNSSGKINVNFYRTENTTWFFSGTADYVEMGRSPLFVGLNNAEIVGDPQEYSLGLGFRKQYDDQRVLLAALDYGSASDRPFKDSRNTAIGFNVAYAFQPSQNSQWLLFVSYSNNRVFLNNVPLPSFAYIYKFSGKFSVTLGIPFVFTNYFNFPKSTFNMFLTPGSVGYDWGVGIVGPMQFYNSFAYKVKSFMHHNRLRDEDRLFIEDKTIEVGLRSPVAKYLSLSLSSGLSFDRYFYEGEGVFDEIGQKQKLAKDIYFKTKMTWRF